MGRDLGADGPYTAGRMRPTIAYQPALDGVRALAVLAVLLLRNHSRQRKIAINLPSSLFQKTTENAVD